MAIEAYCTEMRQLYNLRCRSHNTDVSKLVHWEDDSEVMLLIAHGRKNGDGFKTVWQHFQESRHYKQLGTLLVKNLHWYAEAFLIRCLFDSTPMKPYVDNSLFNNIRWGRFVVGVYRKEEQQQQKRARTEILI
jgi:hypothetical protein